LSRAASSRVRLLAREDAPILAKPWYREDGSASPLTRSLAHAPDVMAALMPFLAQIMGESSLELPTKELVILRISQLNGCRYCLAAHRPAAASAGVPDAHAAAVCDEVPLDTLPARERALIEWIDQTTVDPAGVTDELAARTLDHVRDDQLIELTLLAGAITMLNRYCTAFAIPPPGL
jgi:AhpD family alkylhydroperoxidase